MRPTVTSIFIFAIAGACLAQTELAVVQEPASCSLPLTTQQVCTDGAIGDITAQSFGSLSQAEATAIVSAAAAALNVDTATIAIVDRTGRPITVFRQFHADPATDDVALGVAPTAPSFLNTQPPPPSHPTPTTH